MNCLIFETMRTYVIDGNTAQLGDMSHYKKLYRIKHNRDMLGEISVV